MVETGAEMGSIGHHLTKFALFELQTLHDVVEKRVDILSSGQEVHSVLQFENAMLV